MFDDLFSFIRSLFPGKTLIALHEPVIGELEKSYLNRMIDSGFVSSVGEFVTEFEQRIAEYTGSKHAVAVTNGTAALHLSLLCAGVKPGDEVITQSLTFIATANAITYTGASPVFIDVDDTHLGLSAEKLTAWIQANCDVKEDGLVNRNTGNRIAACVPMHTFGNACSIAEIQNICKEFHLPLIEDAAEALGSFYDGQHLGTFSDFGVLSFNGNKVITTGGGGIILTNSEQSALWLKHMSTTAKQPHPYLFNHDAIGFNYRMPNINAALGCAQLERLPSLLNSKRQIYQAYQEFFRSNPSSNFSFVEASSESNCWLNSVKVADEAIFERLLEDANAQKIMLRPVWTPLHQLPIYKHCEHDELKVTQSLARSLVNLPSSGSMDIDR